MTPQGRALARAAAAAAILAAGALPAGAREGLAIRAAEGPRAATAARLARGGEGGELRLAATAMPIGERGERLAFLVVTEIDTRALVTTTGLERLGLELNAYAVRGDGEIVATASEAAVAELAALGPELAAGGLRWLLRLDLPPGTRAVRVHVRERGTGLQALAEVPIVLPRRVDPASAQPSAPGQGDWVDAVSPRLEPADLAAVEAAGGPPSALPVLAPGPRVRLSAWSIGRPTPPSDATLFDERGRPVAELAIRLVGAQEMADGVRRFELNLDLPDREGFHALRLRSTGEPVPAPPMRLVIRRDAVQAWNRLLASPLPQTAASAAGAPAPAAGTAASPLQSRAGASRALRNGYLAAWGKLAEGDRQGALADLVALEQGLERRQVIRNLEASEAPLLADLARRRPAALRPLLTFYRDLELAHLAGGRPELAARAGAVCERLAESLAEAAATPEEKAIAATAFESLAGDAYERGVTRRAVELLRRATELAPERTELWLALGTLHERDRELDAAATAFDRALAASPTNREVRLRRARVAGLVDRHAGDAELERLVAEPQRDWVGVVAWQELARGWLDGGKAALAAERLARATDDYPDEASLALTLAYARERAGRRSDARAAAARAAAIGPGSGVAPRKRYSEPPRAWFAARRAELARATSSGGVELATELDAAERLGS